MVSGGRPMKLPFISREAHAAICAAKDAQIATLQRVVDEYDRQAMERREYAEITAMQLRNAARSDVQVPVESPAREPSMVGAAIREMAQGDTRLSAYLHKRKRELRAEHPGMGDEGIIELLSTWESSDTATEVGSVS